MQPIHELLSRIRWDPEFGVDHFELGYHDRVENRIMRVPIHDVVIPEENSHVFELIGDDGQSIRIPFHRVREVFKDGVVIWQRPESHEH
jgi:uncharacterized protein (UPF0248 family)